jgi:hypothetical protein
VSRLAVVEKIGIREQVLLSAGLVNRKETDHAGGIAHGHRTERQRVQEREDDRVDCDPDPQGEDRGDRERRRPQQGSEGVAKIVQHGGDG